MDITHRRSHIFFVVSLSQSYAQELEICALQFDRELHNLSLSLVKSYYRKSLKCNWNWTQRKHKRNFVMDPSATENSWLNWVCAVNFVNEKFCERRSFQSMCTELPPRGTVIVDIFTSFLYGIYHLKVSCNYLMKYDISCLHLANFGSIWKCVYAVFVEFWKLFWVSWAGYSHC